MRTDGGASTAHEERGTVQGLAREAVPRATAGEQREDRGAVNAMSQTQRDKYRTAAALRAA